jgi:prepilin-type N-terminal cleavage/methylation domain-containing protein
LRGIAVAQKGGVQKLRRYSAGFTLLELLFVVGMIGVISAVAMPMFDRTISGYKTIGAARGLTNAIAVGKIRAAATFRRVRIYVDLSTNTHHLETLDRSVIPAHWTVEGGATELPYGVSFGFMSLTAPPSNTQPALNQSVLCQQDDGTDIANTACITFNSRGVPVDTTGAPVATGALYITDQTTVYGVTAAASGMIRLWRAYPHSSQEWVLQ